ncbi:MAG: Extracellular solute-binding protein [Candidatus Uhrbacteria bacterium GW2011_GWA2_53_10]|uniref:Extracellular solute-binding protein n=1 Tax=Candidatus Uhrbacteria bacterium GW2011_GWA2_53_10 TaxID=1618980 RepID=A0A0G2AKZ8_9BACT|nr:MAG: Extracellular solute-binding protein [Candidatus Uhrbacteria bacterium GW2011_GWA2_53_10]
MEAVEPEKFASTVIEPRGYDLLLTGILFGIDSDPYPFWHSSQSQQGGLNLAGYNNRKVDLLLEEARTTTDDAVRIEKYKTFQEQLAQDLPAIFLYQSTYTYAVANKLKNVRIERLTTPADRFANISQWYIKTRKTLR